MTKYENIMCNECMLKLGHYKHCLEEMDFCQVCAPKVHKKLKETGEVRHLELAKAIQHRTPQFISEVEKIRDDLETSTIN